MNVSLVRDPSAGRQSRTILAANYRKVAAGGRLFPTLLSSPVPTYLGPYLLGPQQEGKLRAWLGDRRPRRVLSVLPKLCYERVSLHCAVFPGSRHSKCQHGAGSSKKPVLLPGGNLAEPEA